MPGPDQRKEIPGKRGVPLPSRVTVVWVQVRVLSGPASARGAMVSVKTSTTSLLEQAVPSETVKV
jgi:hypothetical protein